MFAFLKRLFGKGEAPAAEDSEPDIDLGERLVRLQRDSWRPAPAEKAGGVVFGLGSIDRVVFQR